MYEERLDFYKAIEEERQSKLLVYVTGDRPGLETKISTEALDYFVVHLDAIGNADRISLLLYTRGGDTLASWSIANLIRQFCKGFEVIIPSKAHSGGTLISLGADRIIMTKQAALSPIDPSVNTPLNPQIPGAPPNAKYPVSVEALNSFIEFAKGFLGDSTELKDVLLRLVDKVHPLVLGQAYRTRSQIRMLGNKLIKRQITDDNKVKEILKFLCSESGSHDYTIDRKEAKDLLGLNVEKPSEKFYKIIKDAYDNIAQELQLTQPFEFKNILGDHDAGDYSCPRALIESVIAGSHVFVTEGQIEKHEARQPGQPIPQTVIRDNRRFDGWKYIPNE